MFVLLLGISLIQYLLVNRSWNLCMTHPRNSPVASDNAMTRHLLRDMPYGDLWDEVDAAIGNDVLYPKSFDVDGVLAALRKAKIIKVDLLLTDTSYKWILTLEGGRKAIFKPQIVPRNKRAPDCLVYDCEHPAYEVAGFAFNRLLDLRNMPFTTGRVLAWHADVVPVATKRLLDKYSNITDDGRTPCAETRCNYLLPALTTHCFKDGVIPGAMMYFLPDTVKLFRYSGRDHNAFKPDQNMTKLDLPLGNDSFCRGFRQHKLFREDSWFADLTDNSAVDFLMSHVDSKDYYINRTDGQVMNVMLDYGRAFCGYPQYLRLVAPITQCCKIRKRVYLNLLKYRGSLLEAFENVTRTDPLYPVLEPDLLNIVKSRHTKLLELVAECIEMKSSSQVLMDV